MEVLWLGKSSIRSSCSIAMFDFRRLITISHNIRLLIICVYIYIPLKSHENIYYYIPFIDHSIPLIDHIPFIDHTIPLVIYIYTSLPLLSYIPLGICIFHRKIDVYPIASPDSNRLTAPWRMLTSVLAARGEPWLLCDVSIVLHFKKR